MATINGAKALQLDSQIGSVEVGKVADLIAINMRCIEAMPVHNLFSSIVYASGREQYVRVNGVNCRVTHVWVGGKALMEDGQLTTIKLEELYEKVKEYEVTLREENPYINGGEECSSPFSDAPSS